MLRFLHPYAALLAALTASLSASLSAAQTKGMTVNFVASKPPTRSSHASTIVETPSGIVASWFGGTAERAKDVEIWLSHLKGTVWSQPVRVASGTEDSGAPQYACWNPVLFQQPKGSLRLFYKVGPSPDTWWGRVQESNDGGKTWGASRRLPDGLVGPVRNKPILLPDGSLLCGSSSEDAGWRVHMERSRAPFTEWTRTPPLNDASTWGAIQPSLLDWQNGKIQILVRTRQKVIAESWSSDSGKTWSPLAAIGLPNPNSGIDAIRLQDGRALVVYNPNATNRATLSLALSPDGSKWTHAGHIETTLDSGQPNLAYNAAELSYPAVIQASDGQIHLTYTWKREKIRHVVLNPKSIALP